MSGPGEREKREVRVRARSPWDFVFAIAERTRHGEREREILLPLSKLKGATGQAKRHIAQATKDSPFTVM